MHKILLLSRIVLDSVGRITLLFIWVHLMYGNFEPLMITLIYYGTAVGLLLFNTVFNSSGLSCQPHYILGRDNSFTAA